MKQIKTIKLEDSQEPLDYEKADLSQRYEPIWSDGSFDGTYIPKMVGTVPLLPEGEIILRNGSIINFSRWTFVSDGSIIINHPYYYTKVMMR